MEIARDLTRSDAISRVRTIATAAKEAGAVASRGLAAV